MEPHELTVADASTLIARKALSPVELMEALLRRSRKLEPKLRVWVTLDEDRAMEAARQAETRGWKGETAPPLHGIPIGVKDIFYTRGVRTTMGSPIYADFVPDHDSTAVARLKKAGAIVMGKTVTTEFACMDPPPTRNPWNPECTPGGSSSGSAVGVAARMFPAATGSQTGGSILRPASYNGIVGLKPTYGRISRHGVMPVAWSLDTIGHFARTVEDAAILLAIMAGRDSNDHASSRRPVDDYFSAVRGHQPPPRIGVLRGYFDERATPEVREHTKKALGTLAECGARIEETAVGADFETLLEAHRVIMAVEAAAVHEKAFMERPDDYGPRMRGLIESGMITPAVTYVQALRSRHHFKTAIRETLQGHDILLTPTTTSAPPGPETTGDPAFQKPWSTLGLPTITLPSGLGATGLPLGIQLISGPFTEARLLAAARWCEDALGVRLSPPV